MWWMAAGAALSMLGQASAQDLAYRRQKAEYEVNKILDEGNRDAQEIMRKANNEVARQGASLSNHMRSISNQRLIAAAGEQYNALGENLGRTMDQAVTGSLQRRIQAAEEAGAMTAAAATAGVGGSMVHMLNNTMRLRNAMIEQEVNKQEGYATYDQVVQRAGVMQNAYDQWDYSLDEGTQNYFQPQTPVRMKPVAPSGLDQVLGMASAALPFLAGMGGGAGGAGAAAGGGGLWSSITNLFSGSRGNQPVTYGAGYSPAQAFPIKL